jgi:hypothetical protein
MFDELMADFLRHNPRKSNRAVSELMEWSSQQTTNPTVGRRRAADRGEAR